MAIQEQHSAGVNQPRFGPLLIPVQQAFAAIGVKTTKGYELIEEGALVARKIGSRTMIDAASIQRYVEGLPVGIGAEPAASRRRRQLQQTAAA